MLQRQPAMILCSLAWLTLAAGCSTQWSAQCAEDECQDTYISGPEAYNDVFYPFAAPPTVDGWSCTPRNGYCEGSLEGFDVYLSLEAFGLSNDLPDLSIAQLAEDLVTIEALLEPLVMEFLTTVPIWIDADDNPEATGLYQDGWIKLPSAQRYLDRHTSSPAIILHELAHAWHDLSLGFDDEDINAAYERAMSLNLYGSGGLGSHYASGNEREYFATLSEAWFWQDNEFPSNRAELLSHDSVGAETIERAWRW